MVWGLAETGSEFEVCGSEVGDGFEARGEGDLE